MRRLLKIDSWILFVSRRYYRSARKNRGIAPSLLSSFGIAAGVMTLIVVLAVMNGFQLGYIEDILEISSYHLRVSGDEATLSALVPEISAISGVRACIPFRENQSLLLTPGSHLNALLVKALPADVFERDPGFAAQLNVYRGDALLQSHDDILVGADLARMLLLRPGDTLELAALSSPDFSVYRPESESFRIAGIYNSEYDEYDAGVVFIPLENAKAFFGVSELILGVKLKNRFNDQIVAQRLQKRYPGLEIVSWREYNRAFFGALRFEKLMMMLLLGLIFVVVSVNIFQFLKRNVMERSEEIGILRSLGASPLSIRRIFTLDGFYIGVIGSLVGLLPGLWISRNINTVFHILENLLTFVMRMAGRFGLIEGGPFPVSHTLFYLEQIPVRLLPFEITGICFFAVSLSTFAAWRASRRISVIKPVEVLHNE